MRATILLVGSLALPLLGGCAGKSNDHAPPPLNKQLLVGKWKTRAAVALIAGYEFDEGGAFKMNVQGMDRPLPGHFTWSGDRDLTLKYEANEDVKKAYAAAAKAFKDQVQERVEKQELPDRALPGILSTVRDELPAEETFRVALSEQPRSLTLSERRGATQRFDKVD